MAPVQKEETIAFRLTRTLRKKCETAAEEAGLTLPDWIRASLALAANRRAFGPRKHRRPKQGGKR